MLIDPNDFILAKVYLDQIVVELKKISCIYAAHERTVKR